MARVWIIVQTTLIIFFITVIIAVQLSFSKYSNDVKLSNIEINISDTTKTYFIERKDILSMLEKYNFVVGESSIKDISISEIETEISKNLYIKGVEVYSNVDGDLSIDIKQFEPKIRLIDKEGNSYFIDEDDNIVEFRKYRNKLLPIISQEGDVVQFLSLTKRERGDLSESDIDNRERINKIKDLVEFVEDDKFWDNLISQIYINKEGLIELIPKMGSHVVTLCHIDSLCLKEKYFDKLAKFYAARSDKGLWTLYDNIDLRFDGQVVCKKIKGK